MTVIRNTPAKGDSVLLGHVQMLALGAQLQPPQSRLSDSVGPGLAGLLVHALRGNRGTPRSGHRV
jgi:hypothetical protein